MTRNSSPSLRPSAPRLELTPDRSRIGLTAVLLCLSVSLITTLIVPMAAPLRALLLLLLVPAGWRVLAAPRWRSIRYHDGQWRLLDAGQVWTDAELLPDTLRHRSLVVLRMRLGDGRRVVIPLFSDALPAADHSALRRVLLRPVSPAAR